MQQCRADCCGRRSGRLRRAFAATLAGSLLAAGVAAADELKPFEASYSWIWNGMTVAVTTLKLAKSGDDTWTYTSSSEPRGIGKLMSQRPRTQGVLRITPTGVQPLTRAHTARTSPTTNTFVFIAAPSIAPLTILSP